VQGNKLDEEIVAVHTMEKSRRKPEKYGYWDIKRGSYRQESSESL